MKSFCQYIVPLFPLFTLWGQPSFTETSVEAGINHTFNIYQGTFGGGAIVFDMNNDGWDDLFLAGGVDNNKLYLNNKNGTFSDISAAAGLQVLSGFITQGGASADINKDGFSDLVITTIAENNDEAFTEGHDFVLLNSGDNTFRDVTGQYGLFDIKTSAASASFGDFNEDGFIDLYITGYFKDYNGRLDEYDGNAFDGDRFFGGGSGGPDRDYLYLNQNGNTFIEVSESYGIDHTGFGFSGVWTDYDNDLDLDLLIANDFGDKATGNLIYRNNYPERSFTERSEALDFRYRINGMGIGVADYNFDGIMDYYVTNIQRDPFLQGVQGDAFKEISAVVNTATNVLFTDAGLSAAAVTWGVNFFDADNDMDIDLYAVNGCLNPNMAPNPNLLFENISGKFLESGFISNTNDPSIGRGSVYFDFDNDGDLDLLVVNQKPFQESNFTQDFKGTRLYRNDTATENNWLQVDLKGFSSELNGIGSRVEAYIGNRILVREVDGGSSHMSQNSSLVHFGLGANQQVDSLIVKWSNSLPQRFENVRANQAFSVEEADDHIPPNEAGFILYPIPFNQNLTIALNEFIAEKPLKISIFDANGTLVYRDQEITPSRLEITIAPQLSRGMYIIEIEQGGVVHRRKIIR